MSTPHCFACQPHAPPPSEAAWEWSTPRAACPRHAATARLAAGDGLFDRLQSMGMASQVRDGHPLGRALNPVWIACDDGRTRRAWATYAAGCSVLHEDRFGAESFFDARMLEFPDGADLLYTLRLAEPAPQEEAIRADPMAALIAAVVGLHARLTPPRPPSEVYSLAVALWNEQRRFGAYLAAHTLVSAADAQHFCAHTHDMLPLAQVPQDSAEFHLRLFALAHRRFP